MQLTSMSLDLLRDDRNPPFHWCSYFKFQNNGQHFDSFCFSKIQNYYVTDPRFESIFGKITFILNQIRQRICGLGYYRGTVLGHHVFCGESICLQIPGYFSPLKRIHHGQHTPGEVLFFFLRLLLYLTRKTLCTILLDSRKYRRTCLSTEEELCICQSLKIPPSSYYLLYKKLFSGRHSQVKDPLPVYSIYTLFEKCLQKTHPFPKSLLDPLCTSIKFHRRFNEGNIITFSAFLFLVSSYEISLKDLKNICATVVVSAKKLVNKKRHSEGTFDYAFPDINLCAALVPGLYFFFLDLSESPDEHGYLFNVLIQKFFKKSRVKYFVEAICDFFNFPAFFSPVVPPSGCAEETFRELEEDIPIPESDEAIDLTFPPSPGENVRETERQLSLDGLNDYPQVYTPPPGIEIISPKSSPCFYGFRPEDTYHELLVTREEIDVIDGVKIVSFKDLSDLEEYSRTHGRTLTYPIKGKPSPPVSKLKGQRIMPTKTRDITKIKGWRNKVFASELYQESQSYYTVNPSPAPEPTKFLGKCRNKVFVSKIGQELLNKKSISFPIDPEPRKALEKLPHQVSTPEIENEFQNQNTGKPLLIPEPRNMSGKGQDDEVDLKPDSCWVVKESKPELELSRSFDLENIQTRLVQVKEIVPLASKKLDFGQNIKGSCPETVPETPVHKLNATVISETISLSDPEPTLKNPMGESSLDLSSILSEIDVGPFKDVIPDIWDLSFKEEYQHARGHINNIYSCLVRDSYFSRKVKKILSDKKKTTGTFFCKLVDVYLTQYSNLKFSYDAPKLKSFHSPESYEDNKKSFISLNSSSSKLNVKYCSETCERIFPLIWPQDLHIPVYGTRENECIIIKGKPVCLDVEPRFSDTDQTSPNKTNAQCKTIKKRESPRKRHLSLLESCQFDEDEEVGQLAVVDKVPVPRRVSRSLFAIPCSSEVEDHFECIQCVETSRFRLGMVVTLGYNRPLNQETISNIELLKKDSLTIDDLWANIAASAVISPFVRTLKRIIVPVVSKPLIDIAQYSLKNISRSNIGEAVWEIVSDMADYVVRKETFDLLDIPLDPDVPQLMTSDDIIENHPKKFRKSRVARELSKLCNVSLVEEDEIHLNKSLCCKEHCSKGCVCDSLSGELLDDTEPHCRNEECMFECSCGKYSRRKGVLSARKSNLAKEESTWHQKVICNSSEVVFQGDVVKTKREKKLPTRYRQGDICLGKEMHLLDPSPKNLKSIKSTGKLFDQNLNSVVSSSKRRDPPKIRNPNEIPAKSPLKNVVDNLTSEDIPKKEVPDNGEDSADEDSCVKRRLDFIPGHRESDDAPIFEMDEIEEALGEMAGLENMDHILNYAFIWCTLHSDYYCSCSGHVFCTKLNILIKERIHSKHCTLKELSAPMSNAARFSMIHLFNRENECARTAGSCFNYRSRNKSLVFKGKRELEIKYNIFSSTNSLVKLHFKDLDNCISYFDQCMSKVKALEKVLAASCHPRADQVLDRIHSKVHQTFSIPLSSDGEFPSGSGTERSSFPTSLPESSRPREAVVDFDSGSEFSEESDSWERNPSVGPTSPVNTSPRSSSCSPSLSLSPKSSPPASLSLPSASPTSLHSPPSPQVKEPAEIFKFGLLCMTRGFGYLPVNCYTPVKLSVRDPLYTSVFHTFRDLHAANIWLNRFFKERIMFEDIEVKLEWVIVRANLLKEFNIFDKSVLFKAVDRCGRLVNKKKLMGKNDGYESAVNSSSEDFSGDETRGEKRSPYSVDEKLVSKKLKSDEDEADTFVLFEEDGC